MLLIQSTPAEAMLCSRVQPLLPNSGNPAVSEEAEIKTKHQAIPGLHRPSRVCSGSAACDAQKCRMLWSRCAAGSLSQAALSTSFQQPAALGSKITLWFHTWDVWVPSCPVPLLLLFPAPRSWASPPGGNEQKASAWQSVLGDNKTCSGKKPARGNQFSASAPKVSAKRRAPRRSFVDEAFCF